MTVLGHVQRGGITGRRRPDRGDAVRRGGDRAYRRGRVRADGRPARRSDRPGPARGRREGPSGSRGARGRGRAVLRGAEAPVKIGILTGGGDVPGLNACIKAVVTPGRRGGPRGRRHPPRLGRAARDSTPTTRRRSRPTSSRSTPTAVRTIDRSGGTVLHTSRTNPAQGPAAEEPAFLRSGRRDGPVDHTHARPAVLEPPGHRRADPDRRRRHALVRAPAPRRGRPGRRHPQDDGQRRPRHRLLHRVLDGDHADGRASSTSCARARARTSGSPWSRCSAATAARPRWSPRTCRASTARSSREVPFDIEKLAALADRRTSGRTPAATP